MNPEAPLLHVAIESTEDGLVTRIVSSPVGQASAPFVYPMTSGERDGFWASMAEPIDLGGDRSAAQVTAQSSLVREVGERLFNSLFADDLMSILRGSFELAYQQRVALHLRLTLPDRGSLLTLPWEYLFDPARHEFLSLSPHSPLSRYVDRRHQIRPLNVESPLRVLVVIANADGLEPVDVRQEWIKLIDTIDYLGMDDRLVVERLEKPTLFELQKRLRQRPCHILHLIGHAVYNETAQDGRLVLEDEVGRGRMMSGQHLGQFLRDHYATRLVILQSCDPTLDRYNPMGLVAQNIVQRGVPAAVVLPYYMPDSFSLAFLHDLYANIAEMKPVDLAVVEARRALAGEASNVLWGLPWLLARTTSGQVFDDGSLKSDATLDQTHHEPSLLERVLRSNFGAES
jgi:hypothetical protein